MKNIARRTFQLTALASLALVATGSALAQAFPSKTVKIIVGAPAGGAADVLARTVGEQLSKAWKQSVIVENKPGAAGLIGTQELLKQPRDGYTLMVGVNGLVSEVPHAMKMPIDPMKELYPLANLGQTGLVFTTGTQLPINTLKEAIAYAKANPGKTNHASYSAGTLSHTIPQELNKLAGIDMQHIPFAGSPPAITQVVGGQIQFMLDGPASIPQIKGGKLKALATTAPKRMGILPDVPTFTELGYPTLTEVAWMGLWTTPDVPAAVRSQIAADVAKVMQMAEVKQRIQSIGMDLPPAATPEQLHSSLVKASAAHAKTLQELGFKLQ